MYLLIATMLLAAGGGVSGQVVSSEGAPIANARVFMEPGIAGTLIETPVGADGRFQFAEAPVGPVGFIAHAPGYAFGGQHENISMGETPTALRIVLRKADSVTATVKNSNGDKVEGARVTRIALLEDKVGIPLAKLKALGFEEPATDKHGVVKVPNLPVGTSVALKIGHPDYAQEGVENVKVGTKADVTMYRGVLVDGSVSQSASQSSVGKAAVVIRNAQPPYDTAFVQTDTYGVFNLRLKPGVYLCQAQSVGQSSPGWQELVIKGESKVENCRLSLVDTGVISGKLMDAVSGKPVEGARITLETNGNMAAVERTGPSGAFQFIAGQGHNVVTYAATPGYQPPAVRTVALDLKNGDTTNLPDVWLAPVPPYTLTVLDEKMQPIPNARVQLLRPRQFGWQTANANGVLSIGLSNLEGTGKVVGMAEDPAGGKAALFQLESGATDGSRVQVLPLCTLTGRIVGERSKTLSGVMVGAILPGEEVGDSLLLWRVMSDKEGKFSWPVLVPGFPQICVARGTDANTNASKLVQAELAGAKALDAGDLKLEKGSAGKSVVGEKLAWQDGQLLGGKALGDGQAKGFKIVFYVSPDQLSYVLETLHKDLPYYEQRHWAIVVVCSEANIGDEARACASEKIPVYAGTSPTTAQTFLLNGEDSVLMETFDVPSFSLLNAVFK